MTIDDIRNHFRVRQGYWFVPKLFGIGATPVTWQGWAVTFAFAGALLVALRFLPTVPEKLIVSLALTATAFAVIIPKTQGGWKWRWGNDA